MGITESTGPKDSSSTTAASIARRPKETSQFYFYDVYRNSGGIISETDVQNLQRHHPTTRLPSASQNGQPKWPTVSRASHTSSAQTQTTSAHSNGLENNGLLSDYEDVVDGPSLLHLALHHHNNNNNDRDDGGIHKWDDPNDPFWKSQMEKVLRVPQQASLLRDVCDSENCSYTCHQHCSSLVTLNCKTQTTELGNEFFEVQCKRPDSPLFSDSPHGLELRQKIESFNVTAQGYEMELQDDGETFHGFIRVHMNLTRPINVLAGTRPPSIYDIIHEEEDTSEKTLTSFYLPRDTVKALHVTSETTTQEVITALLKKFKVVDNPRKFCLYEKYWAWEGSVKGVLRRMLDDEKPLCLVLAWHIEQLKNRKLVLQENDTGDILWDAFSLPELNNFLRILDREEEEYLNQVRLRYKKIQEKLKEAMDCFESGASEPTPVPNTPEDPYTNM